MLCPRCLKPWKLLYGKSPIKVPWKDGYICGDCVNDEIYKFTQKQKNKFRQEVRL